MSLLVSSSDALTIVHWFGCVTIARQIEQETLRFVTIAMICSNLASLWKSQYFRKSMMELILQKFKAVN